MTHTTPPPSDDDLPDERELAGLYARLPKVEPDASLDAAVLAEAARAMPVNRRPRWPVALASAAVLVLAVGVAWQVRELQPAPSSIPPAAAPAPAAADGQVADRLAAKSIAAEAAPTTELRKSSASHAGAASTPNVGAASAPNVGAASAAMPAKRAPLAPQAQVRRLATPIIPAQVAPAPQPAAPPSPPASPAFAEPVVTADTAVTSNAPASTPAPAIAPAPAPAPAPQRYKAAAPMPSGMLLEKLPPNALGPDDRVGEIRRLLGRGDRAQALRELKDLRQRYPHYDLPQDLRDLNP